VAWANGIRLSNSVIRLRGCRTDPEVQVPATVASAVLILRLPEFNVHFFIGFMDLLSNDRPGRNVCMRFEINWPIDVAAFVKMVMELVKSDSMFLAKVSNPFLKFTCFSFV